MEKGLEGIEEWKKCTVLSDIGKIGKNGEKNREDRKELRKNRKNREDRCTLLSALSRCTVQSAPKVPIFLKSFRYFTKSFRFFKNSFRYRVPWRSGRPRARCTEKNIAFFSVYCVLEIRYRAISRSVEYQYREISGNSFRYRTNLSDIGQILSDIAFGGLLANAIWVRGELPDLPDLQDCWSHVVRTIQIQQHL